MRVATAASHPHRVSSGYTLTELLIVLAVAGLFTAWFVGSRPSRVGNAVVALRSQVLQARFEAIERNAPVAVVYRGGENAFVTLAGESGTVAACETGTELGRLEVTEFGGVAVASVPAGGLVWLPSGSGRTCSGSGAFNQTIVLEDGRREGRVIVSRAGRVRSEVDL